MPETEPESNYKQTLKPSHTNIEDQNIELYIQKQIQIHHMITTTNKIQEKAPQPDVEQIKKAAITNHSYKNRYAK